jgi:hypothetical protein
MREVIKIEGGHRLNGEVTVSGSKNATVALIPAAVLAGGPVTISGVPAIADVDSLSKILRILGCDVTEKDDHLIIDPTNMKNTDLDADVITKLRASYYFMGALLGKYGYVRMKMPGGCYLGPRPIDLHIKGFEALGATVEYEKGCYTIQAEHLKGTKIFLDISSVGATINIMMAALLHDIGKIKTRTVKDDVVHFYEHERASENMIPDILRALKEPVDMINEVKMLSGAHMLTKAWKDDLSGVKKIDRSVRKLQYRFGKVELDKLLILIDADNMAHAEGHCLPNQARLIREVSDRLVAEDRDMFDYRLPVDGNDVMEVRNIKPSKDVRLCMQYLIKLAYNRPRMTREECLREIKSWNPTQGKA